MFSLRDESAAEADGHRVGAAARLQLREEVPDVRFHRLFREVEAYADVAIDETVRDQLEDLDLAHRGFLLELSERRVERDHVRVLGTVPARGDLLEASRMVQVPAQNVLALSSVHVAGIGTATTTL